jgi:hypothetical protein
MKKIVLMVVAMFVMTAAFAENENNSTMKSVEAYDMTINMRKLAVTLDLTSDQMEAVQDIHNAFCNDMMLAAYAQSEERSNMVNMAVKKDMRYMHYILNDAQYKKYELLLMTTLKNRGLK